MHIIWNFKNNEFVGKFYWHSKAIRGLAMLQDSITLISASKDKTIIVWDLETRKYLRIIKAHLTL